MFSLKDGTRLDIARRHRPTEGAGGLSLAFIAEVPVNWCPALGTVLANEEVTNEGRSDRGNYPVYQATHAPMDDAHHGLQRTTP